jgi:glycine oxidase
MDIYKSQSKHVKYNHFNHVILGAGLAGLTLCFELLKNGQRVLLLDVKYPGAGASGTPAGLMNPATAQKALMPDDAIQCVNAFMNILSQTRDYHQGGIILHDKILRPATDQKQYKNFMASYNSPWPNDWVEWIDTMPENFPQIPNHSGGLMLKIGKAIDVPLYLLNIFKWCKDRSLNYLFRCNYKLSIDDNKYSILVNNETLSADNIIDCTGLNIPDSTDFNLHKVKGQIRVVHDELQKPLNVALSSYGYLAQKADKLIVGSTYEHYFSDVTADTKQDDILLSKIHFMTGKRFTETDIHERWAGIRITTPDRKPAIGSLPSKSGYHYYTGLGSKGLFYSAYLSKLLSDHLINSTPIPKKYHISRLVVDKQKKSD